MGNWTHTYREGQIAPQGTINATTPGRIIAKAISEIHEKVVTDVDLQLTGGITGRADVLDGVMNINLGIDEPGDTLPTEGLPGQVLTFSEDGNHFWDWVRAVEVPE